VEKCNGRTHEGRLRKRHQKLWRPAHAPDLPYLFSALRQKRIELVLRLSEALYLHFARYNFCRVSFVTENHSPDGCGDFGKPVGSGATAPWVSAMKKIHTFLAGAYAFAIVMAVVETIRGNFPLWGWVFSPLTIYFIRLHWKTSRELAARPTSGKS
jgi:hypothetical protein